jgi:DNA-binding SARP family transcriptional activator
VNTQVSILRVQLFGKFQIFWNEAPIDGFDAPKLQELMTYLLIYRDRAISREKLADVFWGQFSNERARKYLRQSLWQVHTTLEVRGIPQTWIIIEPEWVQFMSNPSLWIDVAEFEDTYRKAIPIQRSAGYNKSSITSDKQSTVEDRPRWQILREVADLYQGELLPGCYQDWCIFERERLQDLYLKLLDELMYACEIGGEFDLGIEYGTKVLRYDWARERTHRRLMRLYFLLGDRTAALRQFERCKLALQEEFGVEPTQLTLSLIEQIRSDLLESKSYTSQTIVPNPIKLRKVLSNLNSLDYIFRQLQSKISEDINIVEQMLNGEYRSGK